MAIPDIFTGKLNKELSSRSKSHSTLHESNVHETGKKLDTTQHTMREAVSAIGTSLHTFFLSTVKREEVCPLLTIMVGLYKMFFSSKHLERV
jgi:hypothetical protein